MLVIAGDWKTAGHRLRKPAQGTAPAIGRRHSPCNRTQAQPLQSDGRHAPQQSDARHAPQQSDARHDPLQSDTRYAPCNRTPGTVPTVGCKRRPYIRWQRAAPRESARPWTPRLSPALALHSPPFGGRGWGWVSPPNAKRVPAAHGLGNPRLLKGGGYLLSRIALQYHRRRRA